MIASGEKGEKTKKKENLQVYSKTLYATEMKLAYHAHCKHINIFEDLLVPFEINKKTNLIRREYRTGIFYQ